MATPLRRNRVAWLLALAAGSVTCAVTDYANLPGTSFTAVRQGIQAIGVSRGTMTLGVQTAPNGFPESLVVVDQTIDGMAVTVRANTRLPDPMTREKVVSFGAFYTIVSGARTGGESSGATTQGIGLNPPIDSDLSKTFELDYAPADSGPDASGALLGGIVAPQVVIQARFVEVGSGIGGILGGTVSVDCGGGAQMIAIDGSYQPIDVSPAGGTCAVQAALQSRNGASGDTYHGLSVLLVPTPGACLADVHCTDPAAPLCNGFGCTDGRDGDMCVHDADCDRAGGFFCGSFGTCTRGLAGTSCLPDTAGCADGLACVGGQCTAP